MSEELKRTYNPCDECPYGIEKRDGSGNDSTCKICEFADLVKANRRAQQPNEPLTLEQLRQMDGEPVWISGWNRYGILGRKGVDADDDGKPIYRYVVGFAHGWEWLDDVLADGRKAYVRPPEAGEKG